MTCKAKQGLISSRFRPSAESTHCTFLYLCVCVFVFACLCICICGLYLCIFICVFVCLYICIGVFVCLFICICVFVFVFVYLYLQLSQPIARIMALACARLQVQGYLCSMSPRSICLPDLYVLL